MLRLCRALIPAYLLQSNFRYNKRILKMKKYIIACFAFFALALASCSSGVKMTSSWNDNAATGTHIKKILVLGLFGEKSRDLREQMENQMADNLNKLGYNAVTSMNEFGPRKFVNISEDRAMRIIDSSYAGVYDGVIVVSIVDKKATKSYVPGYYSPRPYYGYGWGYSPFYSPFYTPYVYRRGHYQTNRNYSFETNFYNTTDKKLIYSGVSDVSNPTSPGTLASDYSRVVLKDMRKKNVLS